MAEFCKWEPKTGTELVDDPAEPETDGKSQEGDDENSDSTSDDELSTALDPGPNTRTTNYMQMLQSGHEPQ
jgi:hypothetical protein